VYISMCFTTQAHGIHFLNLAAINAKGVSREIQKLRAVMHSFSNAAEFKLDINITWLIVSSVCASVR